MDFVEFVNSEMQSREWSRADLSRKSGIAAPQITRVLNREQNPGELFCKGIARAFNVPEEDIFRRAGILTSKSKLSPLAERAAHIVEGMTNEDAKEMLVDFLQIYAEKENKRVSAVKRQAH